MLYHAIENTLITVSSQVQVKFHYATSSDAVLGAAHAEGSNVERHVNGHSCKGLPAINKFSAGVLFAGHYVQSWIMLQYNK